MRVTQRHVGFFFMTNILLQIRLTFTAKKQFPMEQRTRRSLDSHSSIAAEKWRKKHIYMQYGRGRKKVVIRHIALVCVLLRERVHAPQVHACTCIQFRVCVPIRYTCAHLSTKAGNITKAVHQCIINALKVPKKYLSRVSSGQQQQQQQQQ